MMTYDPTLMRSLLTRREGRVPYAYQDKLGIWSIGVGQMIDRRYGGRLADSVIDLQLSVSIQEAEQVADAHIPWWRDQTQGRQMVALDLLFNLGWNEKAAGGLDDFKNTLAAWERGDYAGAAAGLRSSQYAHQLPERSESNASALATGEVPK